MALKLDASSSPDRRPRPCLHVAPMLDVSHRDFRYFTRLFSRRATLWTSMVGPRMIQDSLSSTEACERIFSFNPMEHPIVCQLGGNDPVQLAQAAVIVERYGYDEVNLNVGCPSGNVSGKGEFGVSLMKRKELVRDIVHAMNRAVQIPVTVKTRLGVDDFASPEFTSSFVRTVAQGGCRHFVIHARIAELGLSPEQNRSVPPLQYMRVWDLCKEFPDLDFTLNGGIVHTRHARDLLSSFPPNLQGVMIGRAARDNPEMLLDVDHTIFGDPLPNPRTRRSLLQEYHTYLEAQPLSGGVQLAQRSRRNRGQHDTMQGTAAVANAVNPTIGLFKGRTGRHVYKRALHHLVHTKEHLAMGPAFILSKAMAMLEEANPEILDEPLESNPIPVTTTAVQ